MSHSLSLREDCIYSSTKPSLSSLVQATTDQSTFRAAFEATVVSIGAPVWNTSDGHRPTQAEVDAGLSPAIYTPIYLRMTRLLGGRTLGKTTVVAYEHGGSLGQDHLTSNCGHHAEFLVGGTYDVFLGGEITGPATISGDVALRKLEKEVTLPEIADAYTAA